MLISGREHLPIPLGEDVEVHVRSRHVSHVTATWIGICAAAGPSAVYSAPLTTTQAEHISGFCSEMSGLGQEFGRNSETSGSPTEEGGVMLETVPVSQEWTPIRKVQVQRAPSGFVYRVYGTAIFDTPSEAGKAKHALQEAIEIRGFQTEEYPVSARDESFFSFFLKVAGTKHAFTGSVETGGRSLMVRCENHMFVQRAIEEVTNKTRR